jgi:phospholipid/cholesterol/gamma-HCH transport system permease protein
VAHAGELNEFLDELRIRAQRIDARSIERLDSAGAQLLSRFARRIGLDLKAIDLKDEHRALFDAVLEVDCQPPREVAPSNPLLAWFEQVGHSTIRLIQHLRQLLNFLGQTIATAVLILFHPDRWPVTATVHHIQQTGLNALPLVALLSFLIGAVVAFLGATVLKDFGAELFVVDLTTYAFLREFGVLLTAIILAGRTASAFTAQIGTMKSREEIDAIRTIGLDPFVLLVLPRLIALLIALPILALCAMVAGLAGGLMVSAFSLDIPGQLYLERMSATVELRHFLVGMTKAPLFALVIALVGCLEGFKVAGTAQSVGERTTSAVVQSIAMVIVIDALAAVFFMEIGW